MISCRITHFFVSCLAIILGVFTYSQQTVAAHLLNEPPQFQAIDPQTGYVNVMLTIVLRATDEDGDPLAFGSLETLPPGATITTQTNEQAVFTWTPNREGYFEITFTVADDAEPPAVDSEIVEITVKERTQADLAIAVAQAPTTATVGDRVSHEVEVTNLSAEMVSNVAVTMTLPAGADSLRTKNAECDTANMIVRCDIGDLAVSGSNGDQKAITFISQVNVAAQESYSFTVGSVSNDEPLATNNLVGWQVDVAPIIKDKIQLDLSTKGTLTESIPLPNIDIELVGQYVNSSTNEIVTHTISGQTDDDGGTNLTLPELNFTRLALNVSLTKTNEVTVPVIDFDLSLNNMPPTGVVTTSIASGAGSTECTGLRLWTIDGASQSGDCATTAGHQWSNVIDASHATFRGRLRPMQPPLHSSAHGTEDPLRFNIAIVNKSDGNQTGTVLYLPFIRR